jgi:hypothetical protein
MDHVAGTIKGSAGVEAVGCNPGMHLHKWPDSLAVRWFCRSPGQTPGLHTYYVTSALQVCCVHRSTGGMSQHNGNYIS